ncbi:hypothetical protein ANCDUO_18626, partial [Ancylostoma duodenale]
VEVALQKMQTLAEYVNEMQRVHEQYAPHIDVLRRQNEAFFREKSKWMRLLPITDVLVEDDRKDEPVLAIIHAPSKDSEKPSNPEAVYHVACCQLSLKQQLVRSIKKARSNTL